MAMRKKQKSNLLIGALLIVVAILGTFVAMNFFSVGGQTSTRGEALSATGDCNTAPSLTVTTVDAQQLGTSVTTGYSYEVNGVYQPSTPSTFAYDDEVRVIANASGYIDLLSEPVKLGCGVNTLNLQVADYSAPTVEIKQDNTVLTDSATGGANNASAIVSGGSDTFEVCLTGTDKDSTGDLMYVVELGASANVSVVSIAGLEGDVNGQPSFYTTTLSSPYVIAFDVPSLDKPEEVCYKMTVQAKSGKTVSGAVYTTAYVKEAYIADDGSFMATGVEDESGDTTYEATFDEDFFITA